MNLRYHQRVEQTLKHYAMIEISSYNTEFIVEPLTTESGKFHISGAMFMIDQNAHFKDAKLDK